MSDAGNILDDTGDAVEILDDTGDMVEILALARTPRTDRNTLLGWISTCTVVFRETRYDNLCVTLGTCVFVLSL